MNWIKRLLRRIGLIAYEPYVCNVCGYLVPLRGTRWAQASIAFNHWQERHE